MAKSKTKFRSIQKILSVYTKKKGIHLGRDFNKIASKVYKSNTGKSLKEIRKSIGKLYDESKVPDIEIPFPTSMLWYDFETTFADIIFDGIEINIIFPEIPEFGFSGFKLDVINYFKSSELRTYLRTNYSDETPVATFELDSTDKKTTVTYRVDVGENEVVPKGYIKPKTAPTPKETPKPEIDKQIELEKLKSKNMERKKELFDFYTQKGLSPDQIMKLIE